MKLNRTSNNFNFEASTHGQFAGVNLGANVETGGEVFKTVLTALNSGLGQHLMGYILDGKTIASFLENQADKLVTKESKHLISAIANEFRLGRCDNLLNIIKQNPKGIAELAELGYNKFTGIFDSKDPLDSDIFSDEEKDVLEAIEKYRKLEGINYASFFNGYSKAIKFLGIPSSKFDSRELFDKLKKVMK